MAQEQQAPAKPSLIERLLGRVAQKVGFSGQLPHGHAPIGMPRPNSYKEEYRSLDEDEGCEPN